VTVDEIGDVVMVFVITAVGVTPSVFPSSTVMLTARRYDSSSSSCGECSALRTYTMAGIRPLSGHILGWWRAPEKLFNFRLALLCLRQLAHGN
jgi:hypothetical protein